jgi:hypothetical protein
MNPIQHIYEIQQVINLREVYTWEQIARALYDILDDIDTSDDVCRESDKAFRTLVMRLQAKKNAWLFSPDGYRVVPAVLLKEGLVDFAKTELDKAGLFSKDSDYEGMLGNAVMDLMKVFASQGHSGFSAQLTRQLFNLVSDYKPLSPLTDNPDEWMEVGDQMPPRTPSGEGSVWQSRRNPEAFSEDGGKTYYLLSDMDVKGKEENGATYTTTDRSRKKMYRSEKSKEQ